MRKIKDPIILGIVAGLAGNAVKLAGNLINRYAFRKSDVTYPEIAAGLFMTKREREKRVGRVTGGLADFVLGGALGVPLVYLLRYTGRDHAALKGLAVGHLAWITVYGALGRGLDSQKGVFPLNADTNLSALLNHSWFGLTAALVAAKLGDESLFPEPGDPARITPP